MSKSNGERSKFDNNTPLNFAVFTTPNPAKGKVFVNYQLPKADVITIKIYSITGQLVCEIRENKPTGSYTLIWDGKDNKGNAVADGVYFYRAESTDRLGTGKIIFLR